MGLAERFALSAYDAAYLELAQRHCLPLASLHEDLQVAAIALGLTILGS
jgi:predicted nucleic acid-binding protein